MNICKINFDIDNIKDDYICNIFNSLYSYDNYKFTLGVINNEGNLNYYLITNKKEELIHLKLKTAYPEIEYDEFKDIINLFCIGDNFIKMKLSNDINKSLQKEKYQEIFIKNLINAIYIKDNKTKVVVEMSFTPFRKNDNINKKEIKKNVILFPLKCVSTVIDLMFEDPKNFYIDKNKEVKKTDENKIENNNFYYKVSIKIGVTPRNENIINNIIYAFSVLNNTDIFSFENISYKDMFNRNDFNMILSTNEISQFFVFPTSNILDEIVGTNSTKNLVDKRVPEKGIIIGSNNDKFISLPAPDIILTPKILQTDYSKYEKYVDDTCKATLVLGVGGTGKSEFAVNTVINYIKHGIPSIVVDPKFDMQKRLIESMPEEYINQVDFLDLGDMLYPPAFNIFRRRKDTAEENTLITQTFINYMKKQFDARSWGYKIQRMLQMTAESVLVDGTATMNEVYWMLTEDDYRKFIINIIKQLLNQEKVEGKSQLKKILKYWEWFDGLKTDDIRLRESEPVLNKLGLFLSNRFINAIVSQPESYDFRKAGGLGRTTIINLPEGVINAENMQLLSNFVNKAIWLDYQSRDELDMPYRYPVKWIIDEAHTIIDNDFLGILTKSRSRRIGPTLLSQSLSNFDIRGYRMSNMISDNCKSKILFKIGYFDAKNMCDEFAPLTASDMINCPDHNYYARILLPDGNISKPFYAACLPTAKKIRNYDDYVKSHRSGKLTMNEIENNIDDKLESIKLMDILSK